MQNIQYCTEGTSVLGQSLPGPATLSALLEESAVTRCVWICLSFDACSKCVLHVLVVKTEATETGEYRKSVVIVGPEGTPPPEAPGHRH